MKKVFFLLVIISFQLMSLCFSNRVLAGDELFKKTDVIVHLPEDQTQFLFLRDCNNHLIKGIHSVYLENSSLINFLDTVDSPRLMPINATLYKVKGVKKDTKYLSIVSQAKNKGIFHEYSLRDATDFAVAIANSGILKKYDNVVIFLNEKTITDMPYVLTLTRFENNFQVNLNQWAVEYKGWSTKDYILFEE